MPVNHGKWPRQYTAEIIALETRAERAKALEHVPEDKRDHVRELVEDYFTKQRLRAQTGA